MKYNIPRIAFFSLLLLQSCTGLIDNLLSHDTFITSFKIEKSKNPGLSQDYDCYIDTFNKRVVVDFKNSSISASVLKTIKPTISYTSREIYPKPDEPIDLNGTVIYTLSTLKKSFEWKVGSCCLNTGSGPTLTYTADWEHTLGVPGGTDDMGFGDGIIKSDGTTENLYLVGYKNITISDTTYIEKLNLTTGNAELSTTVPWRISSLGDKYLSPAFYLALYDGSDSYVRQINTHTLNNTLEATLVNYKNIGILSVPNSGGTRVKGISLNSTVDALTFSVYNPSTEFGTVDCGTGTTEINPVTGETDYTRQTYYVIGVSSNCGAVSSGTDVYVSRWDNDFNLLWKNKLWTSNNDLLPQIGNKRSLVISSDGSVIIGRFWSSGGISNSPGKFDLNGNDITSSTNFPNFPAYYLSRNIALISMTIYTYNNGIDIFYASYNTSTGDYSIQRSDTSGNIRTLNFAAPFSVGCNAGQQTISVAVDSAYNLYFNCLKTNAGTTKKEMYVKKFKATVVQ